MSKVPVPAGIQLDNTDYWVVIFNYQRIYDKIMSGVAFNDNGEYWKRARISANTTLSGLAGIYIKHSVISRRAANTFQGLTS